MIDFQNATFAKLRQVDPSVYMQMIQPMFIEGEQTIGAYQGARDGVVFTTARIFAINVQGVTGKKKDFSSLPYSKVQAFSVETAGVFDMDSELELWFSSLGKVRFEFTGGTNIATVCQMISHYVLK